LYKTIFVLSKSEENVNRSKAEQLRKRIKNEAPYFIPSLELEEWVGGQSWVVKIVARSSNLFLGNIESPEEWDVRKGQDLKPLT
jgi:hypothetical protein